jgi:hypothetical protein
MIEDLWSGTITRAIQLPEPVLHEQVNGEWSFAQTHRHLVLASDCWLRRMVKGIAHAWGLGGSRRKDHTVLQCLAVVLKEEWQHRRYAVRDLAVLETRRSP